MVSSSIHNPDRFMMDLRQILSQGKKRIGLFIGAGAPVSVRVDTTGMLDNDGISLIPDICGLSAKVLEELNGQDKKLIEILKGELGGTPNIEELLTKIRKLALAIGSAKVYEVDGEGYSQLAERVCEQIGKIVNQYLPQGSNPYIELASWIGGTHREYPVEIFTPNYDLLLEEAFERLQLPYFDGFSGAHQPFFDATSISDDSLPSRWSRIWKIHGSLGWSGGADSIIRTGNREATTLIYPEHLKYNQISRQPYTALFERLRDFLKTPDSILLCSGFSFLDAHISSVIEEALAANSHTAVIAFQYKTLDEELAASNLALRRPNMSLYAKDGAIIYGVKGEWRTGQAPTEEWESIRNTFWRSIGDGEKGEFQLGDFAKLARFFAFTQADDLLVHSISAEDDGVAENA